MGAAFGWGLLSASSRVIGSVIALRIRIPLRVIGLIMGDPSMRTADGEGAAGRPPGNPSGSLLTFGRYSGWSLGEIARTDLEYVEWLDRMPIGRPYREEIDAILRRTGRQVNTVREHRCALRTDASAGQHREPVNARVPDRRRRRQDDNRARVVRRTRASSHLAWP